MHCRNDGLRAQTSPSRSAICVLRPIQAQAGAGGSVVCQSIPRRRTPMGRKAAFRGKGRDAAGEERSALKAMARRPPISNIELPHAVFEA